jgi:hypothetical protein
MVPKSDFAFRSVCQLDPIDSILFAAIIREIGKKIEAKRASNNVAFSYRFDPANDGRLYAKTTGWEQYWKQSAQHCHSHPYVLATDLSDFYNQIYHHTVENQLANCGIDKKNYWHAIRNLLANVTEGISRGVPIGPHPAHLLAELAMIPVDHFIASLGVEHCRYVDDIHIFCKDRDHAHTVLYKFVDYLDKTQKIQINKQKTSIHKSSAYLRTCEENTIDKPISALERQLLVTVKNYTSSPYERVRYHKVSATDLTKLSQQNIETILRTYITAPVIDYIRLRWFLRRLAQVGVPGGVSFIVKHFDDFLPAIAEVGQYFESASPNFTGQWKDVGERLMVIFASGIVQANEYLQVVILSLFSRIEGINHINRLTSIYQTSTAMCQRKIALAAAEAKAGSWLSTLKGGYKTADPWLKRAIIYSMRALAKDEKEFWAKSAKKRLVGLDAMILEHIL